MADLGAATKVLYELSARGIKLAIDDYGTGYSSLQYLHKLPVNELKIDRSFVTNLPNEASNRIIVRSSIQMAHSLGLYVIAEGAEDELTCAMLAEAECDFIQGYYLSKPQKAEDLQEWILGGAKLEFAPIADHTGLTRRGDDAPLRLRLNVLQGLFERRGRRNPGGHDSADVRHRLRHRTMPVRWCTVEELVPEDGPARREGASPGPAASEGGATAAVARASPRVRRVPRRRSGDRGGARRRAWTDSCRPRGSAPCRIASAAARPLVMAWEMPSPCIGFTRPAASPTRRTRPLAGVVPTIPILSQPPRRRGGTDGADSSRRPTAREMREEFGQCPHCPVHRPCDPTGSRCRARHWRRPALRERTSRSRGTTCRGSAPTRRWPADRRAWAR